MISRWELRHTPVDDAIEILSVLPCHCGAPLQRFTMRKGWCANGHQMFAIPELELPTCIRVGTL